MRSISISISRYVVLQVYGALKMPCVDFSVFEFRKRRATTYVKTVKGHIKFYMTILLERNALFYLCSL